MKLTRLQKWELLSIAPAVLVFTPFLAPFSVLGILGLFNLIGADPQPPPFQVETPQFEVDPKKVFLLLIVSASLLVGILALFFSVIFSLSDRSKNWAMFIALSGGQAFICAVVVIFWLGLRGWFLTLLTLPVLVVGARHLIVALRVLREARA